MKTVILDDDPTGTQSASDVAVLLRHSPELIADALRVADSVYVQTNSRAIDTDAARNLVRSIREDSLAAGRMLGEEIQFVLRGDSTLRGHVFEETAEFLEENTVILFVPAFPDGGRTTRDGVHYVAINGVEYPADQTEYAKDPVFPFSTAMLPEYVREKSGRNGLVVPLPELQRPGALAGTLLAAQPGDVVCPDAVTNEHIRTIARETLSARRQGASVVIRSAAPLAAVLAGVESRELLSSPITSTTQRTLLVCGSHTAGATRQLERIRPAFGVPHVLPTTDALKDPVAAGTSVASQLRTDINDRKLAILSSERDRSEQHDSLAHGEKVMLALTTAVEELQDDVDVVIAKGGITSAEVVRTGLGAAHATVLGQVLPGVSVWDVPGTSGRQILYVVVPGNVGDDETLAKVLAAVGHRAEADVKG